MSSVSLVVEPSKIVFLRKNTIPQKEDRILLYPQNNTTHVAFHNGDLSRRNVDQLPRGGLHDEKRTLEILGFYYTAAWGNNLQNS